VPKAVEVLAPAKINLTLEILSKRADGYHEIASVMQTIDLCDAITVEDAEDITLEVTGEAVAGAPPDPEQDLALRAARRMAYWLKEARGARIRVHKRIPAGMGLGGGSSDAAAVMRALNVLWGLGRDQSSIARSAAELGSDAPFFVYGGTALCRGRGEVVDGLPDARPATLTLFLPPDTLPAKTASMYAGITKDDFTAGVESRGKVDDVVMKRDIVDVRNAFDRHADRFGEKVAAAIEACRLAGLEVHLAGSGPAFFALAPLSALPAREAGLMEYLGIQVREHHFLPREDALRISEASATDPSRRGVPGGEVPPRSVL
jgi:4-diphosphocytidyl-2-C-methyl-D-erythritol kinase